MGSFSLELPPRYGVHPRTGDAYWPDENNGFGGYTFLTRQWCEAAGEEAHTDNEASEEYQKIQTYIDYLCGKQWSGRRPTYKSNPIDNRMIGLFWELVSHLTDIRPVASVKPIVSDEQDYVECGNMLDNSMRSWWLETDADQSLAMIVANGVLSTAYGKLQWNPDRSNGMGNFEIVPYGMNNVFPLKPGLFLRDSQAIILEEVRALSDIKKKFPIRGPLVQPDQQYSKMSGGPRRPPSMPSRYFEALSPQMRQIIGTSVRPTQSVYPAALYREFWIKDRQMNNSGRVVIMGDIGTPWCYAVKPGQPLYPRLRLIVMAGGVILHDGPSPYWHGEFPIADLRLNMVPWQFAGLAELKSWVPLQDIINNILAGVLDMTKKIVNPIFMGPKNAFPDSLWSALDWGMPGAKAGYNQNIANKPEFGPTPQIPPALLQLFGLTAKEMDRSSGIAAVSEAIHKKQVPAGDAMTQVQRAQQSPIRLKGRQIEIMLRQFGRQSIYNIIEFYSQNRIMYLTGQSSKFKQVKYNAGDVRGLAEKNIQPSEDAVSPMDRLKELAKHFVFLIQPGSLLDLNRVERSALIVRLRLMKDIDRRSMFSELDLGLDVDAIEAGLQKEMQEQQGAMAGARAKMPQMAHGQGRSVPRQPR